MKKTEIIALGLIFILAFGLRFYKLGDIPNGLYQDETAIGYNAYSLLETGRDEYGVKFPLYFKSFGDWKLPVYIYLVAVPVKILGLTALAVRLPSALFGFLTVPALYFLVKAISRNGKLAMLSTFLLSINPWHLHYSRASFEVVPALFFFTIGILLIHLCFEKKRKWLLTMGILCFILAFYSYNLTRLLSPLLLLLTFCFYRQKLNTVSVKIWFFNLFITSFLLLPFILSFFSAGGVSSSVGTLIFSSNAVWAPLLELKSYFSEWPLFSKMIYNKPLLLFWQYLQNIISYFSVSFFFLNGSGHGNHGIGNFGQFYLFELALMILGIVRLIKEKSHFGKLLFCWAIVTIGVASLTREAPHATRSFFIVMPLEIFSARGLMEVWRLAAVIKWNLLRTGIVLITGFFFIYNLLFYFTSYYFRFPVLYAQSWRSADRDLSLYLKENQAKYEKIIFDEKAGFIYSSLLFYSQYPVKKFQETVKREKDDSEGFSRVLSFGKYEFRDLDRDRDYQQQRTLLITTVQNKPSEVPSLKTFYYPRRPVVLSVKEEIMQYPTEEIAYVLVQTP